MKTHYLYSEDAKWTYCGLDIRRHLSPAGKRMLQKQVSSDPHEITCAKCLKDLRAAGRITEGATGASIGATS